MESRREHEERRGGGGARKKSGHEDIDLKGPTTRDSMVAWFVAGSLEGVEKGEGGKRTRQKGGKRAPGNTSLPLDEAGTGVFIRSRTSTLGQAR